MITLLKTSRMEEVFISVPFVENVVHPKPDKFFKTMLKVSIFPIFSPTLVDFVENSTMLKIV